MASLHFAVDLHEEQLGNLRRVTRALPSAFILCSPGYSYHCSLISEACPMKPPPYVPQPNRVLVGDTASGKSSPLASAFNSYLYNIPMNIRVTENAVLSYKLLKIVETSGKIIS